MASINKKSVLIIAFHFAPSVAVGGKRFSFLSNKLHDSCCKVHVLTLKKKYLLQKDDSLPFLGTIHRTTIFPPFPLPGNNIFKRAFLHVWTKYMCLVDPYSGWIIPALKKGITILKRYKIDTIIVTGPPFSPVLSALLLSILFRTRLIIDYRDPWATHPWSVRDKYGNVFFKVLNCMLEKIAVRRSSDLVFTSHIMRNRFLEVFGKKLKVNCHVINNGYNNSDEVKPSPLDKGKINLVFAGELYGERKIELIAKPISALLKEGSINRGGCRFHIFGKLKEDDKKIIGEYDLGNIIKEYQPVPHIKIMEYLKGADILVLIVGFAMDYSISYKFYDYLSVRRPILAIIPENSAMELMVMELDCGEVGYINDYDSIQEALKKLLSQDYSYTFRGAEKFTWDMAAEKYYRVINCHST